MSHASRRSVPSVEDGDLIEPPCLRRTLSKSRKKAGASFKNSVEALDQDRKMSLGSSLGPDNRMGNMKDSAAAKRLQERRVYDRMYKERGREEESQKWRQERETREK